MARLAGTGGLVTARRLATLAGFLGLAALFLAGGRFGYRLALLAFATFYLGRCRCTVVTRLGGDTVGGTRQFIRSLHIGIIAVDAARAIPAALPVALVHVHHFDIAPGTRRMDELAVAHIHANMGIGKTAGIEEDQITGDQFTFIDGLADMRHLGRGTRQIDLEGFLEYITDKTAAIQTTDRRIATKTVGHAQQAHGLQQQIPYCILARRGILGNGVFRGLDLGPCILHIFFRCGLGKNHDASKHHGE